MAKTYRVGAGARLVNLVFRVMTRLGLGKDYRHILTVRGRKTGAPYSIPVDVMRNGDQRWLVAAYGITNWVHNARAAGEVQIARGRYRETLRVAEVAPEDGVPVLRQYLREVPVTRAYFDVTLDSPDERFVAEAERHPVFRLIPGTGDAQAVGG
ncbi:nitroreductase family deazaflavin-dependent oxidoreductase [Actinoallomurus rhizosphaericola]|uniref:nitroreductase family deazaflavin-dependent oxidoreductase n=1 Tax=Actinoallomurus rhizosphaericola TaxID=2952536 RepID=UPI002092B014|nr:nitroreductase family deazaflavin-dependent oxidoreductase [Actinoallomurus rhizosphaericola]MCO5999544.1 nitroreductase family deazaflavin-dependent oxidoreductase [Actinoallomurus rhizosphaericola]